MGKLTRFVIGFILGSATGAVAGLLFAPQPGPELRSSIDRRIQAIADEARMAAAERRAELLSEFEAAKELEPRAKTGA